MATKKPAKKAAKAKRPTTKELIGGKGGACQRKLNALGIEGVCAEIVERGTMTKAAIAIGVSIGSLISWIEANPERSARARSVREHMASYWDEQAETVLMESVDTLGVAKARELAQHYRWRASKIAPRQYGDKLQVDASVGLHQLSDEQIDNRLAKLAAGTVAGIAARTEA